MSGEKTKTVRIGESTLAAIEHLRIGDESHRSFIERLLNTMVTAPDNRQDHIVHPALNLLPDMNLALEQTKQMCRILVLESAGKNEVIADAVRALRGEEDTGETL